MSELVTNPQIINGGQTAYTLSIIYRENMALDVQKFFGGKEVLVKVITLQSSAEFSEDQKLKLIEEISRATNQQTAVGAADRRSNSSELKDLQLRLFEETVLFIERKRGEFEDGVREGYIKECEIMNRTVFFRAALASRGRIEEASVKRIGAKGNYPAVLNGESDLRRFAFAALLLNRQKNPKRATHAKIRPTMLAKTCFATHVYYDPSTTNSLQYAAGQAFGALDDDWLEFSVMFGAKWVEHSTDKRPPSYPARISKYFMSDEFKRDIEYFKTSNAGPTQSAS